MIFFFPLLKLKNLVIDPTVLDSVLLLRNRKITLALSKILHFKSLKTGKIIKKKKKKKKVPIVGERSSTELEMKLTRRLLFPTAESPINKILNERS